MRAIKSRTYHNFLRVMRMIEAKGYDEKESERLTRKIFDQYEMYPLGLSILAMVDMIIENEKEGSATK